MYRFINQENDYRRKCSTKQKITSKQSTDTIVCTEIHLRNSKQTVSKTVRKVIPHGGVDGRVTLGKSVDKIMKIDKSAGCSKCINGCKA